MQTDARPRRILGVPPTVFLVGIVSMLMDVSSEMLMPIMPIFITAVLGGSAITLGLIEGLAKSTASLLKVYSGRQSDLGARKPWVVAGYGLSALSRPLLALSGGWGQLLAARLVDRTGKGLRTAPRDAIIAAATPAAELGRAFGVHRGMDTLGAAIGPLIAFACLPLLGYRGVFWLSAIPATLAVMVLVLFVKEGAQEVKARRDAPRVPFPRDARLTTFLIAVTLFALGNSSDAFLLLRTQDLGVRALTLPLVYFAFNVVYAAASGPAGILADRLGRGRVARWGLLLFALIYGGFALAQTVWLAWALFLLYGVFMAFTEGVWKAYLGELALEGTRGAVFGWYNGLIGVMALPASLLAGLLWTRVSHGAPFAFGAVTALIAGLLMLRTSARTS